MDIGSMTVGKGAQSRSSVRQAQAKKRRKRAAKQETKNPQPKVVLPAITEDDLLAFQLRHFGDDTKPQEWTVDAETALEYNPTWEDDGLGFYDDGVKRTLTDEQVAMFRHSEIETMVREGKMTRTEADVLLSDVATDEVTKLQPEEPPASKNSSFEVDQADPTQPSEPRPTPDGTSKPGYKLGNVSNEAPRPSFESNRSNSVNSSNPGKRRREEEVPYDDRHKRKWEDYIEENDAVEGSMTHRRIVRELDDIRDESMDLEY